MARCCDYSVLIARLETLDIETIRGFYGAVLKLRHPKHLQDLAAPSVVVWDKVYDTDYAVEAYREGFTKFTRAIIDSGKPEEYFDTLDRFLSGCCAWKSNARRKASVLYRRFGRARSEMRKLITVLNEERRLNQGKRLDKKSFRGLSPFTHAVKIQLRQHLRRGKKPARSLTEKA
jgi:hypothetical protein